MHLLPHKYIAPKNKEQNLILLKLNNCINKIKKDMDNRFNFNTNIAFIMETLNILDKIKFEQKDLQPIIQEVLDKIVILLYPFIPHITHFLWKSLGYKKDIHEQKYPILSDLNINIFDKDIMIQVNGKLRAKLKIKQQVNESQVLELALKNHNIKKYILGKKIVKKIYIKDKLLNLVII